MQFPFPTYWHNFNFKIVMADQISKEKNTLYAPNFADNWNEQFLYPLANWMNGMAFKDFDFTPAGKPVIKIAEIKNGISGQTRFTNEEYNDKYLLKKGDMLFCWSGQPQTSIDVFWWDGPEGWLNQHIFKGSVAKFGFKRKSKVINKITC